MGTDAEDRRALARRAIQVSRLLAVLAGPELISTQGWDMLVDLYVRDTGVLMSLTSLSGAATGPSRTSLSVIARLVDHGLLVRAPDPNDGRRVLVTLSEQAAGMLDRCFDELRALFSQG